MTLGANTVRWIPKKARAFYAEVVAVTDYWALKENSVASFTLREARAILCLRVPPIRGKAPGPDSHLPVQVIIARCKCLQAGEIFTLWEALIEESSKRQTKNATKETQMSANARRTIAKAATTVQATRDAASKTQVIIPMCRNEGHSADRTGWVRKVSPKTGC